MVIATFLAREDLQRLVSRADFLDDGVRELERNLLVALAVQQQEGTRDLLDDTLQPEAFELFHRFVARFHVEDPEQVLPGD